MSNNEHALTEGDRVRAHARDSFPHGTVLRVLERGFVLVQWDTQVLETAHHGELTKVSGEQER